MPILVAGSMALDTITTPSGSREEILGGAASFFSVAASLFDHVRLVAVIGSDFRDRDLEVFRRRNIDMGGLERRDDGETFRWTGRYEGRMETAQTLETRLNVLAQFRPTLPAHFRESNLCFLANTDPVTQEHVCKQLENPRFVLLDTMNFWIGSHRDNLLAAMRAAKNVILNDDEARALGGSSNLVTATERIVAEGIETVVIKRGEHGALLYRNGKAFAVPALPLKEVVDPTGAGDSFAGGFMGALAASNDLSFHGMRRALLYATVMASFTVQGFGLERLQTVTRSEVDARLGELLEHMTP